MEHKLNGKVLLAIDVPEDAIGLQINKSTATNTLIYGIKSAQDKRIPHILTSPVYTQLPSGQWQILGIAGQLDESVCRGLVESKMIKKAWDDKLSEAYRNYQASGSNELYVDTSLESWQSFMKSENIPQNYLILVKQ